jgi:CelD/BcsL family acetyltransferase involved in cellulose biosynthesis
MTHVQIVDSEKAFLALRDEWNTLLSSSPSDNPFLTWEWLFSWWMVFRDARALRILTVRNDAGALVGILPLYCKRTFYYGLPVTEFAFIGTGLSDRQDAIAADADHTWFSKAVTALSREPPVWQIIRLEESPSDGILSQVSGPSGYSYARERCSFCPYLMLDTDWDAYLQTKSKSFRRDMARMRDRMTAFGAWELTVSTDPNDMSGAIQLMEDIERGSKKHGTEKSFWSDARNKAFFSTLSDVDGRGVRIDLSIIRVNAVPVAYLLGLIYKKRFYAYNSAYKEEYHRAAPGKLVLQEKIKWCFERRDELAVFDFSRGDSYLKDLWTETIQVQDRFVFFNKGVKQTVLKYGVFHLRPVLKKALARESARKSPSDRTASDR